MGQQAPFGEEESIGVVLKATPRGRPWNNSHPEGPRLMEMRGGCPLRC